MGRVGYFLQSTDAPLQRDELAHELLFLTRGQPVVYYGDEQGFAGIGGDQSARQTLFPTQVAEFQNQPLVTGETFGTGEHFATDVPLYGHISALAALRAAHPALETGAQIERYVDSGAGVYAFSRVDRTERVEYLVAANNANEPRTVEVPTLTQDGAFSPLYGTDGPAIVANADGVASVSVPALGTVVLKADRTVSAPDAASAISVSVPVAGAGVSGVSPVAADVDDATWQETSFAWRVAGSDEWHALGTAEDTSPRVFHDTAGLANGTLLEYRAVSTDAAGHRSASSTYASVGNAVNLVEEEEPEPPIDLVTVPGNHNSEMGCAGDWTPGCEAAKLTLRADGIYAGTFDLPADDYEYKVALNGSWDLNYGANGEQNGPNIAYSHPGGPITFYWNPNTKVVSSTAEGPTVTLPGSFQSEVGCPGDWQPECLASLMQDGDKDGVYTWSTSSIPSGSYEVKVAHGLSWNENYGVGGVPNGGNYSFTAETGKLVEFRYTLATHVLEILVSDPPLAGTGQSRAHWVSEDTLAWPAELLGGASAADATWTLEHSADAALAVAEGAVTGGGEAIELALDPAGLSDAQLAEFPALEGSLALHPVGLDRAAVQQLLTEQLAVSQRISTGLNEQPELSAFTGVQVPGVLDDLYADALASTPLGASVTGLDSTITLWAPTAQSVALEVWPSGGVGDPTIIPAEFDEADGTWSVNGPSVGDEYRWSVEVYAPTTGAIETNSVTDPYSVALTTNSARSVVVDLDDESLRPAQWEETPAPVVERAVDRAIYELHVRDFSISDETVPEAERGTYRAFTRDSAGTAQLEQLAEAGINTVHLLPTFDIATIEERRDQQAVPACDLASFGPASAEQQACLESIRDLDGFNWGYDPFHFQAPEGSYAVDPNGGARVAEFREMVGALHATGLQVVLDEVYNHTAASGQGEKSVLDKIVPGYYQRLNAAGNVETSTCCQNVATEHEVAQKLMVDSVVLWAKEYKVDGFRFDLMGHHSKENMLAVRAALDELTLEEDGVDGSAVYLYGEGWNFGEVANNALFEQATQGQLGGTGIGTFNDRLRDAVHGGSPVDGSSTFVQGYGTGLGTDSNGDPINGTPEQALADLAHQTDLVKLGLAGNLRAYELTDASGTTVRGDAARLPRIAGRLRRPARRGHQLRRRPRQRDALRPLGVQAADGHPDVRPRAHEHAVARDGDALAVALVLARRHRAAPLEVARPEQLQLGRLVQPHRLDGPGVDVRLGPAAGCRQRGQVVDHGPAARRPGAEAGRGRHRRSRGIRSRPAAGTWRGRPAAARFRGAHRREGDLPEQRAGCHAGPHRDADRRPRRRGCGSRARRRARRVQRVARADHRDGRRAGGPRVRARRRPGERRGPDREDHGVGCRGRGAHRARSHRRRSRRRAGTRRDRDVGGRCAEQGLREGRVVGEARRPRDRG